MSLRTSLTPLGGGIKIPFKKNEILIFSTGEKKYNIMLPKGVYKVCLVGTGASGYTWWFNSYGWGSAGGSGAAVELIFYNPIKQNLELYAGGDINTRSTDGITSYMSLNGQIMVNANGGTRGTTSGGGGGTYFVSNNCQVLQILTATNGNNGRTALSGGVGIIGSVSPYNNWGTSQEYSAGAGGFRLEYLRLK